MTPYQILIIASMIEREAKTDADRPKIARVIYNRLAKGMPLAIDAAVRYGTEQAGVDPDSIPFDQQRETPGPYNTYLNQGLPPTPIANPGRASIRAALNPAANPSVGDPLCADLPQGVACEYLYYVLADEDGNHAFAVTPEQHEANVARGRRRRPALTGSAVHVAAVIGHPVAPVAVAGAAQRGVRARPGSTGATSPSTSRRAPPVPRSTPCARSASPACR